MNAQVKSALALTKCLQALHLLNLGEDPVKLCELVVVQHKDLQTRQVMESPGDINQLIVVKVQL